MSFPGVIAFLQSLDMCRSRILLNNPASRLKTPQHFTYVQERMEPVGIRKQSGTDPFGEWEYRVGSYIGGRHLKLEIRGINYKVPTLLPSLNHYLGFLSDSFGSLLD